VTLSQMMRRDSFEYSHRGAIFLFPPVNETALIPIYPNRLPTVPKPSRASQTASLVFSNLPASQSAITRLENRWARKGPGGSNPSSSAIPIKPQ
jgi:hypothetical protein